MPRVVLIGSECSGKTSLAKALSDYYKIDHLVEFSRIYAQRKNGTLTIEDVLPIAKGQLELEKDFISTSSDDILLFDTCILSTYIYSKIYYGRVPQELEKILDLSVYDYFFLTYPEPEWKDDGIRRMPMPRMEMHNFFKKSLEEFNLPYLEVKGQNESRISAINFELERLKFI